MRIFSVLFLGCIFSLFYSSAYSTESFKGQVFKVIDGDSLFIKSSYGFREVRLYGIDAPEYDQKSAGEAKKWLRHYILHHRVEIEPVSIDQYGRLVAIVYDGNETVNREVVKNGFAWVYSHFCHQSVCREWKADERVARKKRLAIWQEEHPIPPWVWRHRH